MKTWCAALIVAALTTTVATAAEAQSRRAAAPAARLDLSKPEDAIVASRKMQCSTRDGEPIVYHWSGRVYSRVPGERDRHLFNVEGMNVRQCVTVNDPQRGPGYRMVSRELMFYLDPRTNEVVNRWANPWTGETVEVVHVANDPVNMRAPSFARGADGTPHRFPGRIENGRVFMNFEAPLFYDDPMGGAYQDYVGGKYHAMEIFDFTADEATLLSRSTPHAQAAVAWVRIASWLPWMKMGDRSGQMVFNASGQVVPGIDALPQVIRDQIATNYPDYRTPPPLDDARPNETSWTYFKNRVDAQRATQPQTAPRGH